MPDSDVNSLFDLADSLLTVASAALATTDAGAPALSYLTPASPAFDCCPALIVNASSLGEDTTGPTAPLPATGRRDSYGRIILAGLTIWALRCAPKVQKDGSVLTADQDAVALEVMQDGWALWNGVTCAIKNGVFEDLCSYVHIGNSLPIAEQGGCVGWQFSVRAEIGGIPCVPGT